MDRINRPQSKSAFRVCLRTMKSRAYSLLPKRHLRCFARISLPCRRSAVVSPPKTIVSIQSEPSSPILNLKTPIPAAQNSHFPTRISSKKAKTAPQVLHKTFRPGARAIYGKVQVVAQKSAATQHPINSRKTSRDNETHSFRPARRRQGHASQNHL
jgi:hypothetical protein